MSYVAWSDGAYTAQVVIDDPKLPVVKATGVLDHRGEMLMRITTPAKVRMGVGRGPVQDERSIFLPKSQVVVK